jgi:hypothetical protein
VLRVRCAPACEQGVRLFGDPVSHHMLQQEIDDLREQAMLLPPGGKRNGVLARANALKVTMKAFS